MGGTVQTAGGTEDLAGGPVHPEGEPVQTVGAPVHLEGGPVPLEGGRSHSAEFPNRHSGGPAHSEGGAMETWGRAQFAEKGSLTTPVRRLADQTTEKMLAEVHADWDSWKKAPPAKPRKSPTAGAKVLAVRPRKPVARRRAG